MSSKRFTDRPYGYFKPDVTGLQVSALPRNGAHYRKLGGIRFFCESCGKTERASRQIFRYHTPGICKACGRYFNGEVTDGQQIQQKFLSRLSALRSAATVNGHGIGPSAKVHEAGKKPRAFAETPAANAGR